MKPDDIPSFQRQVLFADPLSLDAQLDMALADTFPASDPPALLARNGRRSPDWTGADG